MEINKYIIRNCPALVGCRAEQDLCYKNELHKCQDCTDCVTKRIYDLCNKYKEHDIIALQITNLLDIQEV